MRPSQHSKAVYIVVHFKLCVQCLGSIQPNFFFFVVNIDFFGFLYSLMIFLFLLEVRRDSLWWCFRWIILHGRNLYNIGYLCLLCLSLYVDIAGQLTAKRFFPTNFLKDFSKIIDSQPSAWDIRSSKKKTNNVRVTCEVLVFRFFHANCFQRKKKFSFLLVFWCIFIQLIKKITNQN